MKSPFISLSDLVAEYIIGTGMDIQKHKPKYLIHAKWIWKKVLMQYLYIVKSKVVPVDKSTTPYRIAKPTDMQRFINVSVTDHNNRLRSLAIDGQMNTAEIPLTTRATICDLCNERDVLKECINAFTYIIQPVTIDGATHYIKTYKRVNADGSVCEIIDTPTQSFKPDNTYTIECVRTEKKICSVEVKPCGCIKDCEDNKVKIIEVCGCVLPFAKRDTSDIISKPFAFNGKIKLEGNFIYMEGNVPDNLLLSYQTNGECADEEFMIPDYAAESVTFGMDWRASALAPNIGRLDVRQKKVQYDEELNQMLSYLNPVRVEDFLNAQMHIPLWGAVGDGTHCLTP